MGPPPVATRLLEAQLGVIARWQLRRWLPDHVADDVLRPHNTERLERGVYRWRGGARLPEQRAVAAALRVGAGAVLTGPLVLARYGLDGFTGDSPFEVLVPPGRRVRGVGFPHRRDPTPGRPTSCLGEVGLAGPVDALVDSARFVDVVGERALRLAYDQLRWRGLTTAERVRARLDARPDADALARTLGASDLTPESEGERALGALLQRFAPPPQPQVWVTPRRRVDWYFRAVRYGYEYLGSVDHGHTSGRVADDQRDTELRAEGIRLAYVTAADLHDEAAFLATVAGALTVRAHELGTSPPVLRGGE